MRVVAKQPKVSQPADTAINLFASHAARVERCDAAENRKRILITAHRLFAKHGVADVGMADIAQASGVGQGTLYRRFPNKGELCLALMDQQFAEFQDAAMAQLNQEMMARLPYLEQLANFFTGLARFQEQHVPLLCVVEQELNFDEGLTPPPLIWQRMTVRGLLQRAHASGEIRHDMHENFDLDFHADALMALLQPHSISWMINAAGYDVARISNGIRALIHALR